MNKRAALWLIAHASPLLRLLALLPLSLLASAHGNTLDITPASSAAFSANSTAAWSLLPSPSTFVPTARYGHVSIGLPSAVVVSHGYQYDHSASRPLWLSDTWSFSLATRQWHQALPTCTERQVVSGACPCARMGAVLVVAGERAYLHGGDDGGASRGASSYAYNLFADLWSIPLSALAADTADAPSQPARWQLEPTTVDSAALAAVGQFSDDSASATGVPHAQHTGYVRRGVGGTIELIVFGGMTPQASNDSAGTADASVVATNTVWRLPLTTPTTRQWQLMSCSGRAPGARYGHSMAGLERSAESGDAVYVYGGFVRGEPNLDDLWRLSLPRDRTAHCEWLQLSPPQQQQQQGGVQPASRGYATLLADELFVLMFGGSHCAPGCECSHELWAFDLTLREWSTPQLVSSEQPQARYKHTAVAAWPSEAGRDAGDGVTAYVFGGESYQPQKYHSDVWRLRYSHSGGRSIDGVWEMLLSGTPLWDVVVGSVVLLLAVAVVLLVRRRVLRQIKTS